MAKKAQKAAGTAMVTLAEIVAATKANSFVYVDPANVEQFVDDGLVETNATMTNDAGQVAARATAKALAETPANTGDEAPRFVKAATDPSIFTAKRRGGGRPDVYPFDSLAAPTADGAPSPEGMFFVPATAEAPEPWKSLSSTVSAASRRYAREVGTEEYKGKDGTTKTRAKLEYDRKFKIVEGENDGVKGAWVGRIL